MMRRTGTAANSISQSAARTGNEFARRADLTFVQDGAKNEADIGWPFTQPAHEIGKPLLTERNVDPDAIAVRDQGRLQITPDAVQHLELEAICRNPLPGGVLADLRQDVL